MLAVDGIVVVALEAEDDPVVADLVPALLWLLKGAHSLDEYFDTTNSHLGPQWVLLVALGIVGVK